MRGPARFAVDTSDAEETVAAVEASFGYQVKIAADAMSYAQTTVAGDVVAVSDIRMGAELSVDGQPADTLMTLLIHDGTYRFDPWQREHVFGPGGQFVVPNGVPLHFDLRQVSLTSCAFSVDAFRSIAQEAFDLPDAAVRPGAVVPVDRLWAVHWPRRVAQYRQDVLETPMVYSNELLRVETTRRLLVDAVFAFGLINPQDLQADESAAVRRACRWVDDHLRDPITIQDIADAARLTPRGIQVAFRRERDQTPMGYVRAARLAGARADLLDPAAGTTVTTVASRWGFSNPGRFAAAYERAYGEQPNQTLHR